MAHSATVAGPVMRPDRMGSNTVHTTRAISPAGDVWNVVATTSVKVLGLLVYRGQATPSQTSDPHLYFVTVRKLQWTCPLIFHII